MITVRQPESIYKASGEIENGAFSGRWHFSFDEYMDYDNMSFGRLRVFNDDTLSPGAVWPLHPHREIEVVTYCAEGEFRHADENGEGGILKKGWVQHTTVGSGMWHSEINNLEDKPMRFIQMWFMPSKPGLKPSVEQREVEQKERTNKLLLLVSYKNPEGLKMYSNADVYSCFLQKGQSVKHSLEKGHGVYLYVVEGGHILLNDHHLPALAAAKITDETELTLNAQNDAELLLVDTLL